MRHVLPLAILAAVACRPEDPPPPQEDEVTGCFSLEDGRSFPTIELAITASERGGTVFLCAQPIVGSARITKDIVVDGEGAATWTSDDVAITVDHAAVTLRNMTIAASQTAVLGDSGDITLESVSLASENTALGLYNGSAVIDELTVAAPRGVVVRRAAVSGAGLIVQSARLVALDVGSEAEVELSEPELRALEGVAIWVGSDASLTMDDPDVRGQTAIRVESGALSLTGGEIVSTGQVELLGGQTTLTGGLLRAQGGIALEQAQLTVDTSTVRTQADIFVDGTDGTLIATQSEFFGGKWLLHVDDQEPSGRISLTDSSWSSAASGIAQGVGTLAFTNVLLPAWSQQDCELPCGIGFDLVDGSLLLENVTLIDYPYGVLASGTEVLLTDVGILGGEIGVSLFDGALSTTDLSIEQLSGTGVLLRDAIWSSSGLALTGVSGLEVTETPAETLRTWYAARGLDLANTDATLVNTELHDVDRGVVAVGGALSLESTITRDLRSSAVQTDRVDLVIDGLTTSSHLGNVLSVRGGTALVEGLVADDLELATSRVDVLGGGQLVRLEYETVDPIIEVHSATIDLTASITDAEGPCALLNGGDATLDLACNETHGAGPLGGFDVSLNDVDTTGSLRTSPTQGGGLRLVGGSLEGDAAVVSQSTAASVSGAEVHDATWTLASTSSSALAASTTDWTDASIAVTEAGSHGIDMSSCTGALAVDVEGASAHGVWVRDGDLDLEGRVSGAGWDGIRVSAGTVDVLNMSSLGAGDWGLQCEAGVSMSLCQGVFGGGQGSLVGCSCTR